MVLRSRRSLRDIALLARGNAHTPLPADHTQSPGYSGHDRRVPGTASQFKRATTDQTNARKHEPPRNHAGFGSLQPSDDGTLWVQHYTLPKEQPGYAVFDADGRFLGDVETPMNTQVLDIGDDFVLLVWEDDLEIEHVQMYELVKP